MVVVPLVYRFSIYQRVCGVVRWVYTNLSIVSQMNTLSISLRNAVMFYVCVVCCLYSRRSLPLNAMRWPVIYNCAGFHI